MPAAAVVGAAVIGGVMANRAASKQAAATRYAADMADPFRSQRGYYQGLLRNIYGVGEESPRAVSAMASIGPSNQYTAGDDATMAARMGISEAEYRRRRAAQATQAAPAGATNMPSVDDGGERQGFDIGSFLRNNPAYQFNLKEGQRALERSASARGMLKSGGLLRELVSFGQGQASQVYNSEINRIMTLSGATSGSPATAGQIYQQGMGQSIGYQQQAAGAIGYGISRLGQQQGWWGGGGGGGGGSVAPPSSVWV